MQFYTYVWLVFKRNEWVPVYVGKGKDARYLSHLKDEKSRIGAHLKKYPHTYMKFNTGSEQEAHDLEVALIAKFGRIDLGKGPLLNLTDGGEGVAGLVCTEEHKAKLSTAVSSAKKGVPLSEANKAALSVAMKGVPQGPFSNEHKAALSAASKGVPKSEEHKAAMSAARKGVPHSEEHKAAMSAAKKNVPLSEKNKAALSVALSKHCTIDGITIYPSRKALIAALGKGKNGLNHPNFKYI